MKPKAAIATSAATEVVIAKSVCLHCGRPAHAKASNVEIFCCVGCERVYRYLTSERLGAYYQILSKMHCRAPTQGKFEEMSDFDDSDASTAEEWAAFGHGSSEHDYAFFVPNLSCAACLWLIQKDLRSVDGLSSVRINLEDKLVIVSTTAAPPPLGAVARRLGRLGYRALPPQLSADDVARSSEQKKRLVDLGIAGAAFANVMLFATAVYFGDFWGMTEGFTLFFNAFSLAITTATLLTAGRSFFARAWQALRQKTLHVDLPIALALLLSFTVSVYNINRGISRVYFDSITGLIFLLLCGRYMSDSLTHRAKKLAGAASALVPENARSLRPGDIVEVKVGDIIPADGVVKSGATEISETALTGETMPVHKGPGDRVFAGTHNVIAAFSLFVEKAGPDIYLEQVRRMVERATSERSSIETAAAQALTWFVRGILLAALLAGIIWSFKDSSRVLDVVTATLIVSCPCALALATPLTMAFALRRSWLHGVIIKTSDAIERSCRIDAVVVDKTGTLTTGHMKVTATSAPAPSSDHLGIIALATAASRHPVSQALARFGGALNWAPAQMTLSALRETAGQGLSAHVHVLDPHGKTPRAWQVYLGVVDWVHGIAIELGAGDLLLIQEAEVRKQATQVVAVLLVPFDGSQEHPTSFVFGLDDQVRPEAREIVQRWRASGLAVELLSGDDAAASHTVAAAVGISERNVYSRQTPLAKAAHIQKLQAEGRRVMMVGDGVNDAAALACAYLGVAVRGGVDLALSAADVFLGEGGLAPIEQFRSFARYTMQSLRALLSLAAIYNLVAVALALSGILHPLIAASIMPLASATVIFGAYLRRGERFWKPFTSSCRLPSALPFSPPGHSPGPSTMVNSTT